MKVKCLSNSGRSLPASYFALGYTPESEFDIVVGKTYAVYGICMSHGRLNYLLDPEADARPNWYPVVFFGIVDRRVPPTWQFSFSPENEEHGVSAVWGYEELVNSEAHYDGLVERDPQALRLFFRRRVEMDAESSEVSGHL